MQMELKFCIGAIQCLQSRRGVYYLWLQWWRKFIYIKGPSSLYRQLKMSNHLRISQLKYKVNYIAGQEIPPSGSLANYLYE